jgi:hypothetical protein
LSGVQLVMARDLARNLVVMVVIALILLAIFEASGHQFAILPADASPGPVLAGAIVFGALMTFAQQQVRRFLRLRGSHTRPPR